MAVARSVKTRLIEGLIRDFAADTDAATYFAAGFKCGPLLVDQILVIGQVNLSILPTDILQPGVGGVSDDLVAVSVLSCFPPDITAYATGSPNKTPYDYMEHLEKIVRNGSIDPVNGLPNGRGKILDPDWAGSPNDPLKWLNITMATISHLPPVMALKNVAIFAGFIVAFETRLDNITRVRV